MYKAVLMNTNEREILFERYKKILEKLFQEEKMKEQIEKINNQANNIETNLNYIKEKQKEIIRTTEEILNIIYKYKGNV